MPNVMNSEKYKYERTKFLDADGKVKHSASNGDAVARAMMLISSDDIQGVIEANSLLMKEHKNPGLLRMAVGNSLRAKVRKGEPVTIGEYTVKKLDQKQPEIKAPPKPKAVKTEAKKGRGRKAAEPEQQEAAE